MTTKITISELALRVEQLEQRQTSLVAALKMLLPIAIAIPASTPDSAAAVKALKVALAATESTQPQSADYWGLAAPMVMLLSSKAARQHPDDPAVQAIYAAARQNTPT